MMLEEQRLDPTLVTPDGTPSGLDHPGIAICAGQANLLPPSAAPATGQALRANDNEAETVPDLPEVGTSFLGFRLIAVLGQGAFGQVYLAEQGDLANRKVALKVALEIFGESQTLAQLQHTNIVPIYSVHR